MDKEFLIQLTNNLYHLTLLFPKKEPLRYKMRELADEILARPNEKDLAVLDSFFEVARAQNWVSPSELLAVQEEYAKLRGVAEKPIKKEKEIKEEWVFFAPSLRQEKILSTLKEKEKVQVCEMKKIFPGVTKRTLRRDFEQLLRQELIERMGERNNTFYQLRG